MAATPTLSIAPEINPPGNPVKRKIRPPIAPIDSVSMTWRNFVGLGVKSTNHRRKLGTTPYGKSLRARQMRGLQCGLKNPEDRGRESPYNGVPPSGAGGW